MHPILVQYKAMVIGTHDAFSLAGSLLALWLSWRIATRERRADGDLLLIMGMGILVGALFGRFGLLGRYLLDASANASGPTVDGFLQFGGRTLLGGLTGAYLGVVLTKRAIGYRRHTGDLLAPGVALGIGVGRIGCFLSERPGTPTTLPWGMTVSREASANWIGCAGCEQGLPMHPSFLYESVFLLMIGGVLLRWSVRRGLPADWMVEGDLFKCFLLAYATFRFFVEFVRGNPVMAFGLSGSQLMVLPAVVVLTLYFAKRRRTARSVLPSAIAT